MNTTRYGVQYWPSIHSRLSSSTRIGSDARWCRLVDSFCSSECRRRTGMVRCTIVVISNTTSHEYVSGAVATYNQTRFTPDDDRERLPR